MKKGVLASRRAAKRRVTVFLSLALLLAAVSLAAPYLVPSELDVSAQAQIVGLLAGLRDELGLSVAFVSHDLALVSTLCSRVLVLQDGAVAEQGPTQALISAPRSDAARALLAAAWTSWALRFSPATSRT